MNSLKKILALTLVFIMVISSVTIAAVAEDDDYIFTPSASFVASGVTRVAGGVDSYAHGTTIVAATPSGYPQVSKEASQYLSYVGETPAYTTATLTLDVEPDEEPVVSCPNVMLNLVSSSDKSFTWEITGGNAQAGTTLDIVATYKYDGTTYNTHAYSYVCNIENGSSYAMTYHTVKTNYTTHKFYAQNTVNARFIGSNVVYKLERNPDTASVYYNYNTGKLEVLSSGDYNTTLYLNRTEKTDNSTSSNLESTHYADADNKAIAHAYFDTSKTASLADMGLRYVVNSGVRYDPSNSSVNSSYFNSTAKHLTYVVNNFIAPATNIDNDANAAAKLDMNFVYSTGVNEFGANTMAINSPLRGSLSNIADGESFTINNAFTAKNTDAWFYTIVNTLVMPVYLTVHKYDKSLLRQAIEYVMNTPVDTTDVSTTLGKGINPQDWYYSEGFDAFLNALKNANAINQKIDVTQSDIDNAVSALYDAYSALVLKKADYTRTNALLKVADVYYENHPSYLEEQFQALVAVVDSLDYDIHVLAQPAVEKQNAVLEDALRHMKLIPADYTELEKAMTHLPEYPEKYYSVETYSAWKELYDEAEMIILFETISYYDQDLIPVKAAELLAALDALEYADADLEPIETALALVVYDVENYKDAAPYDVWQEKYETALAYSQRTDINVFNNEEIVLIAGELTDAYNALELKDADTTALENAVLLINSVKEADCEATSYAQFKAAVDEGEAILAREDLTIIDNAEINQCAETILEKYSALEMIPADKTALEAALALTPEYDEENYTDESYTAYFLKKEQAQELFDNDELYFSDNETVNTVAEELTYAFEALTLKEADTAALEEAVTLTPALNEEDYTPELYAEFVAALEEGQAILARGDLTIIDNEEIALAAQRITDAYNALKMDGFLFRPSENSSIVLDRENGLIYGLEEGIINLDEYIECENCDIIYTETEGGFGTGTKVEVVRKGEIVETFYIVIFGDVTGDGYVDAFDVSLLCSIANYETEIEEDSAYALAADLDKDGIVDIFDSTVLTAAMNHEITISQVG